jgi:hypothetical protein
MGVAAGRMCYGRNEVILTCVGSGGAHVFDIIDLQVIIGKGRGRSCPHEDLDIAASAHEGVSQAVV